MVLQHEVLTRVIRSSEAVWQQKPLKEIAL